MRAIDGNRFDRFTVGVAQGLSRRSLVKRAIAGAVASIIPIASATRVSAEEQCYFRSGNPIVDDCRRFIGPLGQCGDHFDCLDFTCIKVMKSEGALCNDGQWSCIAGVCTAPDFCAGVLCPDDDPCLTNPRCDPANGTCISDPVVCDNDGVCADGVCPSSTTCLIDGTTYDDEQFDVGSSCRVCDIAKDRTGWTRSDSCCQSDRDCDIDDPCSTGACVDGDCVQTPVASCCPPNQIACGGVCVDGECCADSECANDDLCIAKTCDADTHTCVANPIAGCCASDADCVSDDICSAVVCDADTHVCVANPVAGCCASDGDCHSDDLCSRATCNAATRVCESQPVADCCRNVGDCVSADSCAEPHCNAERGTCSFPHRAGCCHQASDCAVGPRQSATCDANVCLVVDIPDWCGTDSDCGDSTDCHAARCDTTLGMCLADDKPDATRCKVGHKPGACRSGVCRLVCGRNRVECGGRCRHISSFRSDAKNCGGCGNVCTGRRCRRGVCLV